jgi:hypothetical protein
MDCRYRTDYFLPKWGGETSFLNPLMQQGNHYLELAVSPGREIARQPNCLPVAQFRKAAYNHLKLPCSKLSLTNPEFTTGRPF